MERERVAAFKDAVESGAVAAWLSGKPVQFRYRVDGEWAFDGENPAFDSPTFFFRPAPEPERNPITAAEAFDLFGAVIHDKDGKRWRVETHGNERLYVNNEGGEVFGVRYEKFLTDGWTHNGEPICSRL